MKKFRAKGRNAAGPQAVDAVPTRWRHHAASDDQHRAQQRGGGPVERQDLQSPSADEEIGEAKNDEGEDFLRFGAHRAEYLQ